MGLDIEALRKKMKEVEERRNQSGGGVNFWSPKDGRNVIRILPAKDGQEFYSEAKVRYNVGPNKKMVTIPLDSSEPCPIREYVDALYKSGDKDDEKLAKRMKATNRYYFNIIDRSVEEGQEKFGEVLAYGCGASIFTDILGIICDPDYGDITDAKAGYDIIITKSGKGLDTEYKTVARPKQTPIGIDGWEEKLFDLAKLATPKSFEKRLAILTGEDSNEDENENEGNTSSSSKPSTPPKKEKKEEPENPSNDFDESQADDIEAEIQAMLNKHKK